MRRVSICGETATAKSVRTLIARDDVLLPGVGPLHDIQITLAAGPPGPIIVDSIDNDFEREVVSHIRSVLWPDGTPAHQGGIVIPAERTSESVRRDRMTITVPAGNLRESFAVEHGIYRALLDAARPSSIERTTGRSHSAALDTQPGMGWRILRWLNRF